MFSTDPIARSNFITGLRQLADYLDTHPDVPVPPYGDRIDVHADSTDNGGKAQVDAMAEKLGTPVQDDTAEGGHYRTVREFGSIAYVVVAIPDVSYARYLAHNSYRDCVDPDAPVSA
jgi:hypothetical protein